MDKPFSVKQISQEEKEKMPFVITRIEKVVKEMEHYEDQWKEIFPKLRRYGMYFSS